jgi:hypothetical protein
MVGEVAFAGLVVRATGIAPPPRRVRPTLGRKLTERTLNLVVRSWRLT